MASKVVKQIDTNSAKLNYELGVLEDKLKEIEEFVDTFCLKVGKIINFFFFYCKNINVKNDLIQVQILESKMPQPRGSIKILYNFWNYFQGPWKGISTSFFNMKPKEE